MKAYTDLEQSKKLAKILPLESADMHYSTWVILNNEFIASLNYENTIENLQEDYGNQIIPCWSLAALLSVLPDYTLQTNSDGTVFVVCDSKKPMISDAYDNPVDACVAMIERLHELKML